MILRGLFLEIVLKKDRRGKARVESADDASSKSCARQILEMILV